MLNRFRHPAPAVEHRWTAAGVRFWRSDRMAPWSRNLCLPDYGCAASSTAGATGKGR